MKNILVSIITVSYNSEKTIRRTIESVLNQTYKNIEYIIIDGKSTDDTINIVKEYQKKFSGRLKYISESDKGIYDAMNKGIKMAKGDLIGIINSDDYYELNAVEIMVNSMSKSKYQILYGELRFLKNNIETQVLITNHNNLNNMMIPHPTCFVTKNIYDKFGYFNDSYKSCGDYEFMLRMIKHKEIEYIPVYQIIANFSAGTGVSANYKSRKEMLKMKKKYGLISNKKYILLQMKNYFRKFMK